MLRILRLFIVFSIIGTIVGGGIAIYLVYHYSRDLPDYSQLANYHPPSVTRIYSADGKLIEEYAVEHRVFVPISSIPRSLIEAFVASEDKNYFSHPGVDVISIIRAAITNVSKLIQNKRMEGGSTITQQVVKNFLLTSERSLDRKIKEAILSYMLSQTFTKEQILELYLNQTFLGRGAYGVAMAAQNYFNKSVDELTLPESALIAGLPKSPSTLDPEKYYNRAKERRDYVLMRMLEDGYITAEAAKEAIESPINIIRRSRSEVVSADYYAEAVRKEAILMLGKDEFYTGGYTIITSLDHKMQDAARNALRFGIRSYDARKGYRGALQNISTTSWKEALSAIAAPLGLLEYKMAVVLEVAPKSAKIGLKDGATGKIALQDAKWAKSDLQTLEKILKPGDVITVELIKANNYALKQIPLVNGAVMVMNPQTGQILAAEGGYDFSVSKFDRSTQALRQPGSLSKTFVYLAALENDILPNRIFEDAPIALSQGAGMPLWKPKNYKGDFLGEITMRTGLEKSRNLITVRVASAIGLPKVAEVIKRFGINDNPANVFSMVLGSLETTLERMTCAYATIANYGLRVTPEFIEVIKDRNGRVIYRRDTRGCAECLISFDAAEDTLRTATVPSAAPLKQTRILDEATSYQVVSILTGAAQRGTSAATKKLGKIVAGKTGTTNDSKDTWFVGFTPRIVVGTYIGHDTPKDMGKTATGSSVALPVFMDFMEHAYADYPSLEFKVPDSISLVSVDPKTGEPYSGKGSILEAFKLSATEKAVGEGEYHEKTISSPSQAEPDIFNKIELPADDDQPPKPVAPPAQTHDQSDEVY